MCPDEAWRVVHETFKMGCAGSRLGASEARRSRRSTTQKSLGLRWITFKQRDHHGLPQGITDHQPPREICHAPSTNAACRSWEARFEVAFAPRYDHVKAALNMLIISIHAWERGLCRYSCLGKRIRQCAEISAQQKSAGEFSSCEISRRGYLHTHMALWHLQSTQKLSIDCPDPAGAPACPPLPLSGKAAKNGSPRATPRAATEHTFVLAHKPCWLHWSLPACVCVRAVTVDVCTVGLLRDVSCSFINQIPFTRR